MNRMFHEYLDKFIIVFIDDIFIYSNNAKEQDGHLRIALQLLKEKQFFAKFKKCEFWLDRVVYVGHVISRQGIMVDLVKEKSINK